MSLTKLEAVNQILRAIGEQPVSSRASGLDDAESAEAVLDDTSAEVQAKGWHCNTDYNYKLTPNSSNRIPVPATALWLDTTGVSARLNVTERKLSGTRHLYNVDEQTFTFTSPVYVDIIWKIDFEDLTVHLQNYIVAMAAQTYQANELSSVALDRFIMKKVEDTWVALLDAEGEAEDLNLIYSNESGRFIARRNDPRYLF